MNGVLLDTDVFSFNFKGDSRAAAYRPDFAGRSTCLCFQSVAELRRWSISNNWGAARTKSLEEAIAQTIIIGYDDELSRRWASIVAGRWRIGRPIAEGDAWIAATALRHSIPLLTHNATDFSDIPGLVVISH